MNCFPNQEKVYAGFVKRITTHYIHNATELDDSNENNATSPKQ